MGEQRMIEDYQEVHNDHIRSIVSLSDNKRFISAAEDGSIIMWETETFKKLKNYGKLCGKFLHKILISDDDKYLWACGEDDNLIEFKLDENNDLVLNYKIKMHVKRLMSFTIYEVKI